VTSVEQQLSTAIAADATIQGLLATDPGGNLAFYDKQLPQQNFNGAAFVQPCGVYQRISSPRLFVHTPVASQANAGRARFQLTFWGYDTVVLDQIDAAVLAVMRTFDAFNIPGSPPVFTQAPFIDYSSRTTIEPQTQPTLQKVQIDVQFWFQDQ